MEPKIAKSPVYKNIEVSTNFNDDEWREYTSNDQSATPAHLLEWRDIISEVFRYKPAYLVGKENNEICGVLPSFMIKSHFLGRHFISVPFLNAGGICAKDEHAAVALMNASKDLVQESGARHLELRCTYSPPNGIPAREHKVRLILDLPEQPDALWASLRSEIRNRTKNAKKSGLIVEFNAKALKEFYRVFAANMREIGVPAHPIRFFEVVLDTFKDSSELVVVRYGDEVIGGAILTFFRDTLEVPWISCSRLHFNLCPNNILYWEIMKRACEQGYKLFDFGRSSLGTGPATFKLRWGARTSQLYWQYVLNNGISMPDEVGNSSSRFKLASSVWSKLPGSVTDYFGPKLIAHLPG